MRTLALALLLAVSAAPAAGTDTTSYTNGQRSYSTGQVLSILGKSHTPAADSEPLFSGEVSAEVDTKIKCGALRVNLNVSEMAKAVKDVPAQLVTKAEELMAALPMLALCQASPSLCAEIKNINYQINEELKGLTDICRSMDSYIDKQARQGRAQGWRNCVASSYDGSNLANAQKGCNEGDPSPLYTDIAKGWVQDHLTDAPQNVLSSLFQATGEEVSSGIGKKRYQFLSSILGELKLEANGKMLPVFPAQPTTVTNVAKRVAASAIDLACNQTSLAAGVAGTLALETDSSDAVNYWRSHLAAVVKNKVQDTDVANLKTLLTSAGAETQDHSIACNALGRALARETMQAVGTDSRALLEKALANPALDDDIRQTYQSRADAVFATVYAQRADGAQLGLPEVQETIRAMARAKQRESQIGGTASSKGQIRQTQEFERTDCRSTDTCGK